MGCMAGKLSTCMNHDNEAEEITHMIRNSTDCYYEVTMPYGIKEIFEPIIHFNYELKLSKNLSHPDLNQKDFPIFSMSHKQLVNYSVSILQNIQIDQHKLLTFIDCISNNYYSDIPFHNFWHAFSVLQMIHAIGSRNAMLDDYLPKEEYLFLLIAGIGHDICHPGINNGYLTATNHPLATKYNHMSALENHHAAILLEIIKSAKLFLESDLKGMDKLMIEAIISTDMGKHKQCCDEYNQTMQNFDKNNSENRQKFINYFLHCCDLGNQALDFSIASI